jgi:hypothetical protein
MSDNASYTQPEHVLEKEVLEVAFSKLSYREQRLIERQVKKLLLMRNVGRTLALEIVAAVGVKLEGERISENLF